MREELVTSRLSAIESVRETLDPERTELLSEGETIAFLQSTNAIRLVLGTMLGITDDESADAADGRTPPSTSCTTSSAGSSSGPCARSPPTERSDRSAARFAERPLVACAVSSGRKIDASEAHVLVRQVLRAPTWRGEGEAVGGFSTSSRSGDRSLVADPGWDRSTRGSRRWPARGRRRRCLRHRRARARRRVAASGATWPSRRRCRRPSSTFVSVASPTVGSRSPPASSRPPPGSAWVLGQSVDLSGMLARAPLPWPARSCCCTSSRRRSMGFGDVKAALVLGAAVGSVDWQTGTWPP